MQKTVEIEVGGFPLRIETHRWAKQSNGSALLSYKDNRLLVTANMKEECKEGQDFLPLMVDFRENTYAAGKIPGGFFKREGKPSEKEVLLSRLIDRPIRPLFAEGFSNETQVIATLLSADFSIDYDSIGIIGASAALLSSTLPFHTPIAAVKIGWKDGQFAINPGLDSVKDYDMILLAVGTETEIVMMEAGGKEFPEAIIIEGLARAKAEIARICGVLKGLINPDKVAVVPDTLLRGQIDDIKTRMGDRIKEAIYTPDRDAKDALLKQIQTELKEGIEDEAVLARLKNAFHHAESEIFRTTLIAEKRRNDGRAFDEIRPITIELGVLPRTHGSAVFTRGDGSRWEYRQALVPSGEWGDGA